MSQFFDNINWEEVGEEAVADLQSLLQIDTSNPPGHEKKAAIFVGEKLEVDHLDFELLESAPDRMNLITRIEGEDKSLAPLLLSAHLDVVPADPKDWRYPPFAGERQEGFIWGRGAIDMKNMVIMSMWVMKLLKRINKPLQRTVIFAAVADEETGCHHGSHWLVDHHADKIKAGYMISEVGGFSLDIKGQRFYPIQVAEKGQVSIKMRAYGQQGHGSMPKKNSANALLSKAISQLEKSRLPKHITNIQSDFIEGVSEHLSFPINKVFPFLLSPLSDKVLDLLPDNQSAPLNANLRNTATVTSMKSGSDKEKNVIPSEATAIIDGRFLPEQQAENLLREIRQVIGDEIELEMGEVLPAVWIDNYQEDELYQLMVKTLKRRDPKGHPIPSMIPGYTDAKAYHRLGMKCYGFSPVQLPSEIAFAELFHGVDERISVDGFKWGLRTLAELVGDFCG